jgi:NADH:ubiquinone oxidoreductase subunit E
MGAPRILEHCAQKLGIHPGETTRDGVFSLEEVACLASCGTAPAVLVNNFTYVEGVTPQSMDQLIDRLRGEPGKTMARAGDTMAPGGGHHVPDKYGEHA